MAVIVATTRIGAASTASSVTSLAVSVTGNISAGDTVVVACATEGTVINAPTDDAAGGGNTYAPITGEITNTDSIQLWVCVNAKAATTVTMHCVASRCSCCVACYTGGSQIDDGNTASGSLLNPSFTTVNDSAEDLVIAGFAAHGTGLFTSLASSGTLRESIAGAGTTSPGCAIVDNTGAAGATVTTGVTHAAVTWAGSSAILEMAEPEFLLFGDWTSTSISSVASG